MSKSANSGAEPGSTDDISAILDALNQSDLLEIAALEPTVRDVGEAAAWLSGDSDIFGAGEPIAAEIVDVLAPGEDDETQRMR